MKESGILRDYPGFEAGHLSFGRRIRTSTNRTHGRRHVQARGQARRGWKTMDRTSIDEGFDVGCMKLCEAVVQTSRHEDNGANSFKDLALGPLPLVSGFMFL